ncbi:MAG: hypothetical protein J2P28_26070, partial [Actinobacteria bacterium]|nr:hypothetical protein [Actinomycetota bacterium]
MRTPAPEVWRRSPLRSPSRLRPDRSARPDGRSDLAAGLATITLPAAVRRWRSAARLAAGHTVTEAGCAIGLDPGTGKLVG